MQMNCPSCENKKMINKTRDMPYQYKGNSTVIKNVTGQYCQSCGEMILDFEESRRVGEEVGEFIKKINAEAVDPAFIRGVRKKLRLDQKEAAEVFGGGANAFSRYETGKTMPPLALVKLLRVLDIHPELLPLVR